MNTQFYLKTINGFERIEIVNLDYDMATAKVKLGDGTILSDIPATRIVTLTINPITISK